MHQLYKRLKNSGVLLINRHSFQFAFVFKRITTESSLSFKTIHHIYIDFLGDCPKQKKYQLQTLSGFNINYVLMRVLQKNRSLQI
jgi:hypothetical protein